MPWMFGDSQPRLLSYALKYQTHIQSHIDSHRQTWEHSDNIPDDNAPDVPAPPLRVFVRVRPLLPHDHAQGAFSLAAVQPPHTIHFTHPTLTWSGGRFATKTYAADGVFDDSTENDEVWERVGMRRAVEGCFEQEKEVYLLAYGQTGTGKTYTTTYIETRVCESIFDHAGISVSMSAFELRGSDAYDLLSDPPFHDVKIIGTTSPGGVYPGLSEHSVSSKEELFALVHAAGALRTTRSTIKNDTSSRSHSIMRFKMTASAGLTSSIFIVDLAGSERAATSSANVDPARQREAIEVNKALAALKDCIRARLTGAGRVPWRSSKLTMVLQRAFTAGADSGDSPHAGEIEPGEGTKESGASETELVVLACVSPSVVDAEDTLGTLNYVTPFRLSGRAAIDASVMSDSLGTVRPKDPREWSHEDSVTYVTRNLSKLTPFLPRLLPAPSETLAALLSLTSAELLARISTPAPGEREAPDARALAQAKVALPAYHTKLRRLAADAAALDAHAGSIDPNAPRARALASTRRDVLDVLGGKGRDANVAKETRIDWRGEQWDLSKR